MPKTTETTGITDFSKARVGDKVFDRLMQKWGVIDFIDNDNMPIGVFFGNKTIYYTMDGKRAIGDVIVVLVWAEQKLEDDWSILPEMPKRMVKKKIEGWVNIYEGMLAGCYICESKQIAIDKRSHGYLGEPLFISHEYEEYEVDED